MNEAERHRFFQAREKIRELTDYMHQKRADDDDLDLNNTLRSDIAEMAYRRRNASRESAEALASKLSQV